MKTVEATFTRLAVAGFTPARMTEHVNAELEALNQTVGDPNRTWWGFASWGVVGEDVVMEFTRYVL